MTSPEVATQPPSPQTSPVPSMASVPTGLIWTPRSRRPGLGRLQRIPDVLAELVGAGAEPGLVLLEEVGLIGQGWLEVTDNQNTKEESEALSERWPSRVFLPSNKIETFK